MTLSRKILLIASLALGAGSVHAQVASFDCRKAATPAERAVCATPDLGRKDVVVSTYYELLLRLKPASGGMAYREFADRVRDEQRQWLRDGRDACAGNVACLGRAYDARLATLAKTLDDNAALTFGRTMD